MREYKVEYMGYEGKDMYERSITAPDIDSALSSAMTQLDKQDDRIVSIIEIMV